MIGLVPFTVYRGGMWAIAGDSTVTQRITILCVWVYRYLPSGLQTRLGIKDFTGHAMSPRSQGRKPAKTTSLL
jgi:hypothetical protein